MSIRLATLLLLAAAVSKVRAQTNTAQAEYEAKLKRYEAYQDAKKHFDAGVAMEKDKNFEGAICTCPTDANERASRINDSATLVYSVSLNRERLCGILSGVFGAGGTPRKIPSNVAIRSSASFDCLVSGIFSRNCFNTASAFGGSCSVC